MIAVPIFFSSQILTLIFLLHGEMVRGESGPVAINSDFGWVVTGTTMRRNRVPALVRFTCSSTSPIIHTLRQLSLLREDTTPNYKTRYAVLGKSNRITEKEDTKEEFLKDIRYVEDESRYEVRLPWKAEYLPKSNGYSMCLK